MVIKFRPCLRTTHQNVNILDERNINNNNNKKNVKRPHASETPLISFFIFFNDLNLDFATVLLRIYSEAAEQERMRDKWRDH